MDCCISTDEDKKKILDAHREELKAKRDGKSSAKYVAKDKYDAEEQSSVLFACTYGDRTCDTVTTGICPDVSFIDNEQLESITREDGNVTVSYFPNICAYNVIVQNSKNYESADIVCVKTVVISVELLIRHGTNLVLPKMQWMVTGQSCTESLLSRPVLNRIDINTRGTLARAVERLGGEVDVSELGANVGCNSARISRIVEGVVLHCNGGMDENDNCTYNWLDLGEDEKDEKHRAVPAAVREAASNGISKEGSLTLNSISNEFSDVLRIRLGKGPQADVPPMVTNVKENARPVRAEQLRHPQLKREFHEGVTGKLMEYSFLKISTESDWVAATLIVPKAPPASLRLTIDLRLANSCTKAMMWPMPNNERERERAR